MENCDAIQFDCIYSEICWSQHPVAIRFFCLKRLPFHFHCFWCGYHWDLDRLHFALGGCRIRPSTRIRQNEASPHLNLRVERKRQSSFHSFQSSKQCMPMKPAYHQPWLSKSQLWTFQTSQVPVLSQTLQHHSARYSCSPQHLWRCCRRPGGLTEKPLRRIWKILKLTNIFQKHIERTWDIDISKRDPA